MLIHREVVDIALLGNGAVLDMALNITFYVCMWLLDNVFAMSLMVVGWATGFDYTHGLHWRIR